MANTMESLLMGDSSDSDDEVEEVQPPAVSVVAAPLSLPLPFPPAPSTSNPAGLSTSTNNNRVVTGGQQGNVNGNPSMNNPPVMSSVHNARPTPGPSLSVNNAAVAGSQSANKNNKDDTNAKLKSLYNSSKSATPRSMNTNNSTVANRVNGGVPISHSNGMVAPQHQQHQQHQHIQHNLPQQQQQQQQQQQRRGGVVPSSRGRGGVSNNMQNIQHRNQHGGGAFQPTTSSSTTTTPSISQTPSSMQTIHHHKHRPQQHQPPPSSSSSSSQPIPLQHTVHNQQRRGALSMASPSSSNARSSTTASTGSGSSGVVPSSRRVPVPYQSTPNQQYHGGTQPITRPRLAPNIASSNTTSDFGLPEPSPQQRQQQDNKTRKEEFLMFTKVLMKYLEAKDKNKHVECKSVIRDCAKKNRDGVVGYSSLSASMQKYLYQAVGKMYWDKAETYLASYLKDQYKKRGLNSHDAEIKALNTAKSASKPLPNFSLGVPGDARRYVGPNGSIVVSGNGSGSSAAAPAAVPSIPSAAAPSAPSATVMKQSLNPMVFKNNTTLGGGGGHVVTSQAPPTKTSTFNAQQTPRQVPSSTTSSTTGTKKRRKSVKKPKQQQSAHATTVTASSSSTIQSRKGKKTPSTVQRKNDTSTVTTPHQIIGDMASLSTPMKKVVSGTITTMDHFKEKEFSDLMPMVDSVVDYDVSLCAMIFNDRKSSSIPNDMVVISEEQRKLLYGNSTQQKSQEVQIQTKSDTSDEDSIPHHLKHWGSKNLFTSRAAWAKLRLQEEEENTRMAATMKLPGVLTSPYISSSDPKFAWFNEEKAENDKALALISEATEQYVKNILESSMNSARQRLNLDGIRLWHQQLASTAKELISKPSTPPQLISDDQPLHLRLGCDVRRQCAIAEGNSAKTCQRMEEALSRRDHSEDGVKYRSSLDDYATMIEVGSMSELSKLPQLRNASKKADEDAKLCFEIYGGKHSCDAPLGRVPKKAKISVHDIQFCPEAQHNRFGGRWRSSTLM